MIYWQKLQHVLCWFAVTVVITCSLHGHNIANKDNDIGQMQSKKVIIHTGSIECSF